MWQEQEPQRPHLRCRPVLQQTLSHWGWISSLFLSGRRGWGPQSEVLPGRGKWADHSRRQVIQVDNTPRHSSLDAPPKPIQGITTSHVTIHSYIATNTQSSGILYKQPYHSSFSVFIISQDHRRPPLRDSLPHHKRNCNAYDQHNHQNKVPVLWSLCKRSHMKCMCINLHFQVTIRNQICAALTIDVHTIMQCTILLGVGLWKIW